jgi:hypothetical protein
MKKPRPWSARSLAIEPLATPIRRLATADEVIE